MNNLYGIAQFVLFVTSYMPLFVLIGFKQVYDNFQYLKFGGFSQESLNIFISKFGLSSILLIISFFSLCGCRILFSNLKKNVKNGNNVIIRNISNRNSESIGYIATYIIPFMFQGFSSAYEILALLFLLLVIYRIYINSSLLLINPLLNFKYSIFEIEYEENSKRVRRGLIIIRNGQIDDDDIIKIYPIGFKLFYATKKQS